MSLMLLSEAWGKMIREKIKSKKSCDTVPLSNSERMNNVHIQYSKQFINNQIFTRNKLTISGTKDRKNNIYW